MARKLKKSKVSICVFCEGESEQAYTDFLKSKFQDVAVFKRPSSTGLFDDADNRFKKDPKYRDYADVIDEIWFFFDVEEKDIDNWSKRLEIIKRLRRLRKKPQIRVRLLMTNWMHRVLVDASLQVVCPSGIDRSRKRTNAATSYKRRTYLQEGELYRYGTHCPTLSHGSEECGNRTAESLKRRDARSGGYRRAKSLAM